MALLVIVRLQIPNLFAPCLQFPLKPQFQIAI